MQKSQLIVRKPAYHHGQLLLEDDFRDEQDYHVSAHKRHVRDLHGFGVARGMLVTATGGADVTVSHGFAVDREGNEIVLQSAETLRLQDASPSTRLWVTVGYEALPGVQGNPDRRIDCFAVLRLTPDPAAADIRLAQLTLDDKGHVGSASVSYDQRDRMRSFIAEGSITPEALSDQLRSGWITFAFHPTPLSTDDEGYRPPFRVGPTQARAERKINGQDNTKGAAGTMTLPLPPGIRRIERFRIAGTENAKGLTAELVRGGFDPSAMKHVVDTLLTLKVAAGNFYETGDIPEDERTVASPDRTLSVSVSSEGFASISLIALQVSY